MSKASYNQSFQEITNHEAWIGWVPIRVAVETIKKTERNFVLSGGIRDNHYLLTCKTTSGKIVSHHMRYDRTLAVWKNLCCIVYNDLESLIHDHLEQDGLSISA